MSLDPSAAPQTPPPAPKPGTGLHLGGLAEGTQILTAKGLRAVQDLQAGDRVVTRERGMQPLAFVTQRMVQGGEVMRVRPQALGGSSTDDDLILSPSQRVILRDWRAKAMFGQTRAAVAVSRLADGELILRRPARALRLWSLHFTAPLTIYAGEVELCSAAPVTAFLRS